MVAPWCALLTVGLLAPPRTPAAHAARASSVYDRLLIASELLDPEGRCILRAADVQTALCDMHLQQELSAPTGVAHPSTLLPPRFYSGDSMDVTRLVRTTLPEVLVAHPIFLFMAEQTLENDDFYESVYFGLKERDEHSLGFAALCRRLVASILLFEALLALDHEGHRQLAIWYETLLTDAEARGGGGERSRPRSARDSLMGFFLALKGESVLASINTFRELQLSSSAAAVGRLSDVLNDIMRLNIFEAVLSNLSFAFWPDNARAGVALLRAPLGPFGADLTQQLDEEWYRTYLAWNANFIWPSHSCPDMMCFTMLVMPSIALGDAAHFQYRRAHTLFWVVRSTQLTRSLSSERRVERAAAFGVSPAEMRKPAGEQSAPCFHCRQLDPPGDRQPLTSRTALLTRRAGERLAAAHGEDVAEGSGVWRRLAVRDLPRQLASLARIYVRMPKVSPTKLRLL